jgi:hypothetical protein
VRLRTSSKRKGFPEDNTALYCKQDIILGEIVIFNQRLNEKTRITEQEKSDD